MISPYCVPFLEHQCAPKARKGPAARSQVYQHEKQMPRWEMIMFYSVLHLGRWVGDTRNNFNYVALIDQLFSLPTPHSPTHSDVWLSIWMGGIRTTWTNLSPTKGRPEVTLQSQAWLNIDQQRNTTYMLLDVQKTPSTPLLFIPQGLRPHHVKTLSFSVVAWFKAIDYVKLCTFPQKM